MIYALLFILVGSWILVRNSITGEILKNVFNGMHRSIREGTFNENDLNNINFPKTRLKMVFFLWSSPKNLLPDNLKVYL